MNNKIKNKLKNGVMRVLGNVIAHAGGLTAAIVLAVVGSVVIALLPPLVLERVVNRLTGGLSVPFYFALLYFGLTVLSCLFDSARESLLIIFGQKITRGLRYELCSKLSRMPADTFVRQEPGAVVSRFVGDVDTVESLFTSGVISMFADACKIISIFCIIFIKNSGLALLLILLLPPLFGFTRIVQKRMLKAQLENRVAAARVNNHVPESIRCIRMIHTFRKEEYMREKYDRDIQDSYTAIAKTNFYDAVYSPVILIVNALVIAIVMLMSATGNVQIQTFFGMSVGTAVAVIAYIGKVFAPLESIGMEIQTIQSAMAGVCRINEYLAEPERWETNGSLDMKDLADTDRSCVELKDVSFGYERDNPVLENLSLKVAVGEQVTLVGRTGAGKSTLFKLLLGMYRQDRGEVLIGGYEASKLPDRVKRGLFGYVEQHFEIVPGTVLDQITLYDDAISREQAEKAARLVGLHETIAELAEGYDTPCVASLFSQGQWQLLWRSRAFCCWMRLRLILMQIRSRRF